MILTKARNDNDSMLQIIQSLVHPIVFSVTKVVKMSVLTKTNHYQSKIIMINRAINRQARNACLISTSRDSVTD